MNRFGGAQGQWKRNRPTGFGFEAYPNGSFYQVFFLTTLNMLYF